MNTHFHNVLQKLSEANDKRQREWDPDSYTNQPLYRAVELGGEAGEVLNQVKKLVRESYGIRGSRTTKDKLAEELADTIICCSLLANKYGIDLWSAVVAKFNKTSEDNNLSVRLDL